MDLSVKSPLFAMAQMAGRTPPEPPKSEAAPERVKANNKVEDPKEPSLIDEIRDKGMQAYMKEIQDKKKEELREKILREMGLSEEALSKMDPKARGEIEKMIAQEIIKRLQAEGQLTAQQKGQPALPYGDAKGIEAGQSMAKIDGAGVGLGPLLALQEVDAQNEGKPISEDKKTG